MAGSEKRKLDDTSINQGALSKRRSCLLRKASEISVNCNADVALAAFSPCGRFCKFFSLEKMKHVLERYIKLPPEKRHQNVPRLEWRLNRMNQLDSSQEDEVKLFHLETQVNNLELQIKKALAGVEILDTNLKEYEVENEESASLSQVSSCEKNLQLSLQEIKDRKERSRQERNPSMGQTRCLQRARGLQSSFVYNSRPGKQVLNWGMQNLSSSLRRPHDLRTHSYRAGNGLGDRLYQPRGISVGSLGASSSSGGYTPIYRLVSSYVTHQNAIPPVFPTVQTLSGIPNSQNWMHRNSSMQQPIMGKPAMPCVPFQQSLQPLGTSNLFQPKMPGMMNLQTGFGGLESSSVNQPSMGNRNMTPNVQFQHQQERGLDITLLGQHANDGSFRGGGNTSNGQLQSQQQGVLGSTSVGQQVNNVPIGGPLNQTPTSDDNHNPQNGASTMPPISQLQVDSNSMNILSSPNYNTMRNFDVIPPLNNESTLQDLDVSSFLNSESPNCNTLQDFDASSTSFFNSESPNCNTLQDVDVSTFLNSQSSDCNTLQDLDVTSFFNIESPTCSTLQDLDVSSFFNFESPDSNTMHNVDVTSPLNSERASQNLDVTPTSNFESSNYSLLPTDVTPVLNSESIPIDGEDNGNTDNVHDNKDMTEEENPPSESPCLIFINDLMSISPESFFSIPIDGEDNNDNTDNNYTDINNIIDSSETNEKEKPQPESPYSIFINSLLNEPVMEEGASESATNKEGDNSIECDDFGLPENMTLEDFYMLFE